jgi:hypothetical protein
MSHTSVRVENTSADATRVSGPDVVATQMAVSAHGLRKA